MTHPAQLSIEALLTECKVRRTRGTGPGGQHRNKVETAIVVEHQPTGVRGEASERRSQEQNRQQAILRLRVKLALEVRLEPAAQPSMLWQSRSAGGRLAVSAQHEHFPALLAEALDHLFAADYSPASSARQLGVSSSQLIKLLKLEPKALANVNRQRQACGMAPLQ